MAALTAAMMVLVAAAAFWRTAGGFRTTTAFGFDAGNQRKGGHEGQHDNTETTIHGNSPWKKRIQNNPGQATRRTAPRCRPTAACPTRADVAIQARKVVAML
jgi:hypothetical protein